MLATKTMRRLILPLVSLVLAACGGNVVTTDHPVSTPPSDDAATTPMPDPALAACAQWTAGSPVQFTTQADVVARLGKVWRTCPQAPQFLGSINGPGGFEVGQDGHYYKLGVDSGGNLYRMTGFLNEAQVVAASNGVMTVYADGGINGWQVQQSNGLLELGDEAGIGGPFVATDAPVVVEPTERAGAREGVGGCDKQEAALLPQPASSAVAMSALVGRWATCPSDAPGAGPFGPAGNAGIQFNADGSWAFLVGSSDPTQATPSTDPQQTGTFAYWSSGAGQWQLNLPVAAPNGGTYIVNYAMSSSPVKLFVDDTGGWTVLSAM